MKPALVAAALLCSSGAAVTAALVASRGSPASDAAPSPPAADGALLGCARQSSAQFPGAFDDRRNRVVGPLALVGGATFTDAATARKFGGNKFPLLVRAGHRVTVRARGRARIAYGPLEARRAITFQACSAATSQSSADGPVTFWSGFVETPAPACVMLDVRADDEPAARRLSLDLGRRCAAPEPPPLRGCAERAEAGRPSDTAAVPGQIAVGPFRFAGLADVADRRVLEIGRRGSGYGIKSGVILPAGVRATLAIGRSARSWASLDYAPQLPGVPPRTYDVVRFEACAAEHPAFSHGGRVGPVTGFPGGFVLRRAGCVPLEARVSGRPVARRTIRFGVRRCRSSAQPR